MPFAARGALKARVFYFQLIAGTPARRRPGLIAATLAVRWVGVRTSLLQRSELDGAAVRTTRAEAPPDLAGATKSIGRAIDAAPTGSIAPAADQAGSSRVFTGRRAVADRTPGGDPAGISQSLRDAAVAGVPGAQYELAQRLLRRSWRAEGSAGRGPLV